MNSWLREDVAEGQWLAVLDVLAQKIDGVDPFRYFLEAMRSLRLRRGSLLDAGCGVGAYGFLCQKYYPEIHYKGTDASIYMIGRAWELCPEQNYEVCLFDRNGFGQYDIVLASGILEYVGREDALDLLLSRMKHYAILHRMRLTTGPSFSFPEPTYAGHSESQYVWNLQDLKDQINHRAKLLHEIVWDRGDIATFVVEKK